MKLVKKYNQMRRDCWADLECENCGYKETNENAYDSRDYWDNVIPIENCRKCGKSTNDINPEIKQKIATRYPEGYHI